MSFTTPEACEHSEAKELGWGGPARYLRCAACGAFLIASAGSMWRLRPAASA